MKSNSCFLPLICLVLFLAACNKDKNSSLEVMNGALGFEMGNQIIQIEKPSIQIIDNASKNYQSLSIKSSGTETDILLTIHYNKGINPIGIHLLGEKDKDGIPYSKNMALVYEKKGHMLNAYTSNSCKKKKGQIEITEFDLDKKILSGNFNTKVCSAGGIGLSGHKDIPQGVFNKIPFEVFQLSTGQK